jgi:hypothetical protein
VGWNKMLKYITCIILLTVSPAIFAATSNSMPGAYHNAQLNDKAVIDAANFAANEIDDGDLVNIISAESQVVAGINYKLLLEIAGDDERNRTYEAIVFVPLPNTNLKMKLTSFKDLGIVTTTY